MQISLRLTENPCLKISSVALYSTCPGFKPQSRGGLPLDFSVSSSVTSKAWHVVFISLKKYVNKIYVLLIVYNYA
jgi:hypothetical protein